MLLILTLIYPSFHLAIPIQPWIRVDCYLSLKINKCWWWIFAQGEKLSSITMHQAVQLFELLVIRWFVNEITLWHNIVYIHTADLICWWICIYTCIWWQLLLLMVGCFARLTQSQPSAMSTSDLFAINLAIHATTHSCSVRQSWAGIYKKLRFFYWLQGSTCCHTKAYIAFRLLSTPESPAISVDVVYVLCYVMSIASSFSQLLCVQVHVVYSGDVKGDKSQSIEWCQTTDENPHPSASRSNSLMG